MQCMPAHTMRADRQWGVAPALCLGLVLWLSVAGPCLGEGDESADRERAVALARDLLAGLTEQQPEQVNITAATPDKREGDWRIEASWPSKEGTACSASATVDLRRGGIETYVGPPLGRLEEDTPEGRQRAVEEFAREHLGPFTGTTKLVRTWDNGYPILTYRSWDVLPDGAWTGNWWLVVVDAKRKGIITFVDHVAPRVATAEEVKVTRESAVATALGAMHTGEGWQVEVKEVQLVMSSPDSPSLGPVWCIVLSAGGQYRSLYPFAVDATTGKLLEP